MNDMKKLLARWLSASSHGLNMIKVKIVQFPLRGKFLNHNSLIKFQLINRNFSAFIRKETKVLCTVSPASRKIVTNSLQKKSLFGHEYCIVDHPGDVCIFGDLL